MATPVKTETTVRQIDVDGNVIRETTTVVTVETPNVDDGPAVGMYL